METSYRIKISSAEADFAAAAIMGALYATYGEDPLEWEDLHASNRDMLAALQELHLRLEDFLDPWGVEVNFFSVSSREAKLLRLAFRVFSNCFPEASQDELQSLFITCDAQQFGAKGLLAGMHQLDARLAGLK